MKINLQLHVIKLQTLLLVILLELMI